MLDKQIDSKRFGKKSELLIKVDYKTNLRNGKNWNEWSVILISSLS